MTATYSLSEVRKRHGEVFDRAAVEPVLVTKQSRLGYVIVGAELWSEPNSGEALETRMAFEQVAERAAEILAALRAGMPASTVEAKEEAPPPTFLRRTFDAIKRNARFSRTLVTVSDARRDFSAICNRVAFGKERIVIGRHGKNRVAVIPYEDLQLLEELEDRLDLRAALASLKEAEQEGTVAWDDAKRELGL